MSENSIFHVFLGKSLALPFILALILTGIGTWLAIKKPPIIEESLETLLVDYRFKIRNALAAPASPTNVVIVAVDEESLNRHGRWPWKRQLTADLIDKVFAGNPQAVAVDIFFPQVESEEADTYMGQVFAKHRDRLVVATGFEVEKDMVSTNEMPDPLWDMPISHVERFSQVKAWESFNVIMPPAPIDASVDFASVYVMSDRDGKLRWEVLALNYLGEYFASLPLQAARIYQDLPMDKVRLVGGIGVKLGDTMIPTDEHVRLHINYGGGAGFIPYISAVDVLAGTVPAKALEGKAVFVGTSALATYDLISTPFEANMPGVEKNATVFSNIVEQNFITSCPLTFELIILLTFGLATAVACCRLQARKATIFYVGTLFILLVGNQAAFMTAGIRAGLSYPLLTIVMEGLVIFSYRHFAEERKAKGIRQMFSSYVTEKVVEELIKNPEMTKVGGARKEITVMFSDVVGFTTFSEKREPEDVVTMLNEYLGLMSDVIFSWEGTLDKFVGDEIMAFWGAPLPQENHAELAVRCAADMMTKLDDLHKKWTLEGKELLRHGVGINTGIAVVGNIGAEGKKMDYTLMGDTVNLGARLESITREHKADIIISEHTYRKIQPLLESGELAPLRTEELGSVKVKGKDVAIQIYKLVHTASVGLG